MEIGAKIEIVTKFGSNREEIYFSMVQDIISDSTFLITMPMSKGKPAFLHIGEEVLVYYFNYHGQYSFRAIVIKRYEFQGIYFFKLEKNSKVARLQRRNYFRLPKTIPVQVDIFSKDKIVNTLYGNSLDIGGGGLAVIVDKKLNEDSKVICTFTLEHDSAIKDFQVKGRVVRCVHTQNMDDKFEVGISFEDICEQQRDRIIKFIFEEQRKLMKKGLI